MFFQFYDNNLHSFLLGKIESYSVKSVGKKSHYLILNIEKSQKWLEYDTYKDLVLDVKLLHQELNDYYDKVMEAEAGGKDKVMGYHVAGDGIGCEGPDELNEDGEPLEDEPYEDHQRSIGFRLPKPTLC